MLLMHLFFISWPFVAFALVLITVAILGKLIGCGLAAAAFKYNFWESTVIGLGMNGRGAVEVVVATVIIKLSNELMNGKIISEPLLTEENLDG